MEGYETIFFYFLVICIVIAIGLELYKYYYSSQSSGYFFTNTVSTFTPEQYSQTHPHLMPSSRNRTNGQEFSYSFWLLIRKNIEETDRDPYIVLSRSGPTVHTGHPVIYFGGESGTL